ncbi:MAG TPA: DNA polymerase III subunit alpha [Pseudonocardiaceae bacterium]
MPANSFVHLHVHTEYSMLDGAARLTELFDQVAAQGMSAVAVTDHGNLYGAHEFHTRAVASGITPIIGMEAYVAPESRFVKRRVRWAEIGEGAAVSGGGAYTHMTLLARDAEGLRNLFRLASLASLEGHYRKPRIDRELLARHARGLIGTTGCPSGEVPTRLLGGDYAGARKAAGELREILGPENFFAELMDHGLAVERRYREDLARLADELDLPWLVTNDAHYVHAGQAHAHDVLLCVQTGRTVRDPYRFRFEGEGYYLKSPEEMRAIDPSEPWQQGCDNTLLVAEMVGDYGPVLRPRDLMPTFPVPEGETEESWLRKEVARGLARRFPDGVPEAHRAQAEYELDVICRMGYAGYFLVTADLVAHAREVGIRVGPGRGSAAGCLVAYALGITELDPRRHKLLFERFLNPDRVSMPDIDIDFDERRRGEMIRYAVERYGEERVAQIITYSTIKAKAAIKDAARALHGQPGYALADRITKAMPPAVMGKDVPLSGVFDPAHERYAEAAAVRALYESDPQVKEIVDTARELEGLKRQWGVHAAGVILSAEPLLDVVPIQRRESDGAIITQWDVGACEALGLLKMDFLGLRNLTVIDDALRNIELNGKEPPDLQHLELDDPRTYELLARGDTLGVFQLDGGPIRDLLRRMAPTRFEDISAVLALYRPGPMGANAHLAYADRKNGRETPTPIHPELAEPLADILDETYGLIVYQEQVMAIAQQVAGYSLGRADLLRQAMTKKRKEILDQEFVPFSAGMRARGYSDEAVRALWNVLVPFSDYALNRAHAASYGLVSYWTAYLKANHPAEYMAALLSSVRDDKDRAAVYLAECRRMGITVLPPDINSSERDFAPVGADIRFGLSAIRNVGDQVVEAILRARREHGPFTDFADFLRKVDAQVCNKKVVESLIKAGAFDSLGHPRKGLYLVHAEAVDQAARTRRAEAVGQFDLFGAVEEDGGGGPFDIRVPDEHWSPRHQLELEREMLGLYVSDHPLRGAVGVLAERADTTIPALLEGAVPDGAEVTVGGILASVFRRVNRNGEPWAACRLEDLAGGVEVLFFPRVYAAHAPRLVEDAIVLVRARVVSREEHVSLVAGDLVVLDLAEGVQVPPVRLHLDSARCTPQLVTELREVLRAHPGPAEVQVHLAGERQDTVLQLDDALRVSPDAELAAELKALLGPDCLR